MSSNRVYPSVIGTARAEPEAFVHALVHALKAAAGGALLLLLLSALGAVAISGTALEIAHHTAEHYRSVPALVLVIALALMVAVQTGFTWLLSKGVSRSLVKAGTLVLECLAHAFSTGLGVVLVTWFVHGYATDPVTGQSASAWPLVVSTLLIFATGWCGYVVAELEKRGVGVDFKSDRWTAGVLSVALGCILFALLRWLERLADRWDGRSKPLTVWRLDGFANKRTGVSLVQAASTCEVAVVGPLITSKIRSDHSSELVAVPSPNCPACYGCAPGASRVIE